MYYGEDGYSQETIAEMEFCSRQTVSKALQKQKTGGIIRFLLPLIYALLFRNPLTRVRVQLGLEDLILVVGQNMNMMPPMISSMMW